MKPRVQYLIVPALLGTTATGAVAADVLQHVEKQPLNITAISMFLIFVVTTLGITWWAASKTKSMEDFYTAGGGITGFQNGLALAGDYMSAAALLGVTSMIFFNGFDGVLYSISFFVAWPLLLFLFAERIRNLGRITISDIASFRLDQNRIRTLTAFGSLTVVCFYLVVQMVGAGQLIQLLFGLPYNYAVIAVGLLMAVYVTFGGMVATTWVQIIKAGLLLVGGTLLALLALSKFGFSFELLFEKAVAAHHDGERILLPSKLVADPLSLISLALGLAAIVIVGQDPAFYESGIVGGKLIGGGNMPVMHLAKAVGGDFLLGFISAVAFATILAVVSGLTMAGTSAISHDLYVMVFKKNRANAKDERRVSRIASVGIGIVAVVLGILFKDQNIAFLVALTFGVAASVNFPILVLSMYWKGLTTRGALIGGIAGLISAVSLVILSPAVWVKVLGNADAIFPYDYPAIISMNVAFLFTWLGSVTDRSSAATLERARFDDQLIRAQTGLGASQAVSH